MVDGAIEPGDQPSASDLDSVLDAVQSGQDPLPEIHLIIDASYSGGFLQRTAGAPQGTARLIITSTTRDRLAVFESPTGTLSFSAFFLAATLQGNTIDDNFRPARESILTLALPAEAPRIPWLDDGGDGIFSGSDGQLAGVRLFGLLGSGGVSISGGPLVFGDQEIEAGATAAMAITVTNGHVNEALFFVDELYRDSFSISSHTAVTLIRERSEEGTPTRRWSGILAVRDLRREGTYTILYTASISGSLVLDIYAPPVSREVQVKAEALVETSWHLYE